MRGGALVFIFILLGCSTAINFLELVAAGPGKLQAGLIPENIKGALCENSRASVPFFLSMIELVKLNRLNPTFCKTVRFISRPEAGVHHMLSSTLHNYQVCVEEGVIPPDDTVNKDTFNGAYVLLAELSERCLEKYPE